MEDQCELIPERTSEPPEGSRDADHDAAMAGSLCRALSRARETRPTPMASYPQALRKRTVEFALRRRVAGLSFAAIAKELGTPQNTLRNWCERALARVRRDVGLHTQRKKKPSFAESASSPPVTFAPVRVVDERESAAPVGAAPFVSAPGRLELHAPGGLRLVGLDAEEAARVLARLLELRR